MMIYLMMMNTLGLLAMCVDKHKAKMHKWRISEKTLFLIAFLGGAWGSLAGMYIFHHKTKHFSFVIGIPFLCLCQLLLFLLIRKHI